MKIRNLGLLAGAIFLTAQPVSAQQSSERVVTTMHAAPGKYREVVQWLADIDRMRAQAGLEPRLIYRHHNGANWDFLVIEPPIVEGEEDLLEAAAEALGIEIPTLYFREIVMDHEDTFVGGPMSGAEIMAEIEQ